MENKQFSNDPKPDLWLILERVKNMVAHIGEQKLGQGFRKLFNQIAEASLEEKQTLIESLRQENPNLYSGILTATALLTNLFNVAEMSYRYKRASQKYPTNYEGSLSQTIKQIVESSTSEINKRNINQVEMTLTLTAHPTECNSMAFNKLLFEISEHWNRNQVGSDNTKCLPLIDQAWDIIEKPAKAPTPEKELAWAHWMLENQALPLIPKICESFDTELKKNGLETLPLTASPLKFGLWPSFDRDGNPNVTAIDTWNGALEGVRKIFTIYSSQLELAMEYTADGEVWLESLTELRNLCDRIKEIPNDIVELERLNKTQQLCTKEELMALAVNCYEKVSTDSGVKNLLWNLIKQISSFGISLGTPQVRQESSLHTSLMDAITAAQEFNGRYSQWSEEIKISYFIRQEHLDFSKLSLNEMQREVFETFKTIARLNHFFPGLVDRYVISLAKTASDVLAVDYCLKLASKAESLTPCILNIYPLFESQEDVKNSPRVLEDLFSIKYYRAQINAHFDNVQGVMNSHSDFRKEQGNFAGYFGLYFQQLEIAEICREHGVTLKMFQGRGQSRGRGKIDHSIDKIMLMPKGSVNFAYDQTWQGEGARHLFMSDCGQFTIERHLSGILLSSCDMAETIDYEDMLILSDMAEKSSKEYRSWIESDSFMQLYDTVSIVGIPLPIGSRPAKRKTHSSSAQNLRAIAWIKCFHQDRLPVPIYLGLLKALESGEGGCTETWVNSVSTKPLIRAFFQTLERGLATTKTDIFRLAAKELGSDNDYATANQLIENYLDVTQKVNKLLGQQLLLENNKAWMLGLIKYRNSFIDIAHVASIIERREATSKQDIEMTDFFKTVIAVSAGLLCTG